MTPNKKKRDEKKHSKDKREEAERELKAPSYFNYIVGVLLLAIFFLSLYLRAVMPYDSVFKNGVVAFASDDAVFHMRLVENTLYNFPNRLFYDAFTKYPYGSMVHWGPLWTQLIAFISLVAGMGSYNMQTVNTIGAFMPAIFGALVVFPVYYIGRQIGNRSTGLLAAFMIAILPGQFFSRSILGFTDHHVVEVFFSTATIAFFMLALKSGRNRGINFSSINIKEKAVLKEKTVLYSIFAGVMLAAYHLFWPGALLFVMILLIYIAIQYIVDHMMGRSTDYIALAAVPMFLIEFIFILPYVDPGNGFAIDRYSWFHLAVPLAGVTLPIILSVISSELTKREYKQYNFPLFLGGFFLLAMVGMNVALPQLYSTAVNAPSAIFSKQSGGGLTIAEDAPISDRAGMLASNFPLTGFLQSDTFVQVFLVIALLAIGYRIARRHRPEDVLFLVWSSIMLLSMYGQNRWAYYFAVNAALLVGYAGVALSERILKFGGWGNLNSIGPSHMLSLVLVAMLVVFFAYPSMVSTAIGTKDRPPISKWGGGEPSGDGFNEWYETLTWMRNNTPDPGLDYYAIYNKPQNGTYPYPDTAYGVMSWWDYGHIITYWAHRIPNANPFQAGIGGGSSHDPGAATFLTATSEEEANKVLDALGTNGKPGARYIVSNGYMAYDIQPVFATWDKDEASAYDPALFNPNIRPDPTNYYLSAAVTNNGATEILGLKAYNSMEGKLHIFDGNGLKQYRLVHESPPNPNTQGGYEETKYKTVYNILFGGNIPVEYTGLVKVFEHVNGAKITGHAQPNTTVTLTNTIKTNIGRNITYSQSTSSDGTGTYTFTVPYSTLGPIPGETQFDTKPTGPYTVVSGNISKHIDISEKDVLEGRTVSLNLV